MSNIHFEKYARDGISSPIYDFKITIDGEFRAIWKRDVFKPGYELADANGFQVYVADGYRDYDIRCDKQANFIDKVEELLTAGLIPTVAENEERAALRRDNEVDAAYIQTINSRVALIENAALDMYLAIKAAVQNACYNEREGIISRKALLGIERAIELAEGRVAHEVSPDEVVLKLPSGREAIAKAMYPGINGSYSVLRNNRPMSHNESQQAADVVRVIMMEMPK